MNMPDFIKELCPGDVPCVSFGQTCSYIRGVTYNKAQEINDESAECWKILRANNISLSTNTLNFDDIKKISKAVKVKETQMLRKGDILICAGSGSKEHVGKVAYISEDMDYSFGGFMAVIRCDESVNSKYMYYLLTSKCFGQYLDDAIKSSTINNLNSSIMNAFEFPLPPINVQERIVGILDQIYETTDALVTALEKELLLRKRQYAYYRDCLLGFDE